MDTDQVGRLSEALRAAALPPGLAVDTQHILTAGHRVHRRRQVGTALVAGTGAFAVAGGGVWAGQALMADDAGQIAVSPAAGEYGSAGTQHGNGSRAPDEGLQAAGTAAQERQFDCLESRGVPVDRADDGSAEVGPVNGDDTGGATLREMRLCQARAAFPPLDTDEAGVRELYEQRVAAAECLASRDYEVPTTVSLEQFIRDQNDALVNPERVPWTPYALTDDATAIDVCPSP